MANWKSVGNGEYFRVSGPGGGPNFIRRTSFPQGQQFAVELRYGHDRTLNGLRGQIIRAISYYGSFRRLRTGATAQLNLAIAPGATRQRYSVTAPLTNGDAPWALEVPDTSVPIGLLRDGAGNPNTDQWGGLSTGSVIIIGDCPPQSAGIIIGGGALLLDAKPLWTASVPSNLTVGQADGKARINVAYANGEPVVGLALSVEGLDEAVEVLTSSGWRRNGTVVTDDAGHAEMPVRVLMGRATGVRIFVSDARCMTDYFNPPLDVVYPLNGAGAAVGGRNCVVLPPVAPVPTVPGRIEEQATLQWDSGAYRDEPLEGAALLTCTMRSVIGVVLGITTQAEASANPASMTHAWYFRQQGNSQRVAQPMEGGRALPSIVTGYLDDDVFEVRRERGAITYWCAGMLVATSRKPSTAPVMPACALFAVGDSIETVEWQAIEVGAIESESEGTLFLGGDARGLVMVVGTSETNGQLMLQGDALVDVTYEAEPEIPPITDGTLYLAGDASLVDIVGASADGSLYLAGEANDTTDVTDGTLFLSGDANSEYSLFANYGFVVAPYSAMSCYIGMQYAAIEDTIAMGGTLAKLPTAVVRDILVVQTRISPRFEGTVTAVDVVAFGERLSHVIRVLIQEQIVLGDSVQTDYLQIARAVARLVMGGHAGSVAEALISVLDALVFRSVADAMAKGEAMDQIVLGDVITNLYTALASVLDRLVLSGVAGPVYTVVAILRDEVAFGQTLSHDAYAKVLLQDSIGFLTPLSFDNGEYIAWAVNTTSKGLSRYTNYPFNSMVRLGKTDQYYGAAADGLHRLDGSDDNGQDIDARIRLGMQTLAGRKEKRPAEAFIGVDTAGDLFVHVIQTGEQSGALESAIYRMQARPSNENRVKFGKGMKAVEFDFVLENVEGGPIDLKSIQWRPLMLERKTRG